MQPHWIVENASQYQIPSELASKLTVNCLEDSYHTIRKWCESEYSPMMTRSRTAARRLERNGDYAAPGMNFLIAATDEERLADRQSERRSGVASRGVAEAAARASRYHDVSYYAGLLAVLTGRRGELSADLRRCYERLGQHDLVRAHDEVSLLRLLGDGPEANIRPVKVQPKFFGKKPSREQVARAYGAAYAE